MALVLADRVRDTTTTTGTGTITLSGTAPTGYQNFSVVGNGNTTYYTINAASQWEVGIGTYSSTGPTLSRDTVLASSNAGSLVSFSSGTKDVFITYPAEKSVNQNGSVISAGSAVLGVANGGTGATSLTSGYLLKGNGTSAVSASVIYDNGTNAGIGTSSPSYKLDISGNTPYTLRLQNTDATSFSNIELWDNTGARGQIWAGGASYASFGGAGSLNYSANSGPHVFYTNYTERARISSAGDVLIGTTSGGYGLAVVPRANIPYSFFNTASAGYGYSAYAYNGSVYAYVGQASGLILGGGGTNTDFAIRSENALAFASGGGTERMRLDASGNLLNYTSVRAPIFYDYNNTSYYVDPGAGSLVYDFSIGNQLYLWRNVYSVNAAQNAWNTTLDWNSGSTIIYAGNSFRAPIFYDSDNTAYYLDAAGTSNLNTLTVAGNLGIQVSPSYPLQVRRAGGGGSLGVSVDNVYSAGDRTTQYFSIGDATTDNTGHAFYVRNGTATNNLALLINNSSNVGVGTTTPAGKFSSNTGASGTYSSIPGNVNSWDSTVSLFGAAGSSTGAAVGIGMTALGGYISSLAPSVAWQNLYYQASTHYWYNGTTQLGILNTAGDFTALGSVRSPIYYDLNNTAYYVDPAGTSNINGLNIAGTISITGTYGRSAAATGYLNGGYSGAETSSTTGPIYCISTGYAPTSTSLSSMFGIGYTDGNSSGIRSGAGWGMYVAANGSAPIFLDGSNGIAFVNGSVRSPIFYDSNDTNYYVDPSSTSNSAVRIRGGALFGGNPTWGAYLAVGTDGWASGSYGSVCVTNGNLHLDAASGYNTYINNYAGNDTFIRYAGSDRLYIAGGGNYTTASGSMRAPIFYDSQNTAYYVDPAGNSVFSAFNIGGGEVYVYGSATNALGIRTGAGGAYKYFNFDASGNFYALNGSVYGERFYDQNNTAYYLDPDSTSNLNRLLLQPRIDNYYVGSISGTNPVSDWQSLTNTTGQFIVSQFDNFGAGGYSNYPAGVYTYGAVLSWRTANHSFQLYASHTGDLAYKTQWNNDNYSGWLTPVVYGRNAGTSSGKTIFGTVYYDADDSSYYLNPNGNSVIVTLTAAGTYGRSAAGTGFLDGRYGGIETNYTTGPIYCISTSYAPTSSSLATMYGVGYTDGASAGVWSGGGWGMYVAAGGVARVFLDGSNGIASATASLRAPIFYDSNNTAYYVDPASTSGNCAYFAGGIHISGANVSGNGLILADDGDIVDLNDGYCSMRFSLGVLIRNGNRSGSPAYELNSVYGSSSLENQRGFVINGNYTDGRYSTRLRKWDDGGGVPLYVQQTTGTAGSWANVASFGASNSRYTFHVDGIMYTASDVRASQFVDANDTSYYVDPAGTSLVNRVVLTNGFGAQADGQSNDPYGFISVTRGTGANYSYYGLTRAGQLGMGMGIDTSNQFWIGGTTAGYNGTRSSAWFFMNTSGDVWANSSYRAPVFYDSANTSYYVDPAGDTVLAGNLFISQASTASYIYMGDTDNGQRVIHNNSNRIGFLTQAGAWGSYCNDDGSWQTDFAVYSPVYYDLNNTAYYLNPESTSVLGGLLIGASSGATDVNNCNDAGSFSVRGSTTTVAAMSFHRTNAYAINMGIGTDNVFRIGGWSASSNCFQMDGSGNLTMLGNVTAYSDARMKKDVETIDNALDLVAKMRGVRYTRIDTDKRGTGVIAQEMLEVMPEVVQQGVGEDDTLSVAYGNLVGVLIEAVKELTARVAELEGK